MATMRKLYLDGKYVGDYKSTGDNIKDAEGCINLLKAKGLYQETTPEQAIFRQAVSFATTASYLYERDLVTVPKNGMSVAPFVVNAVFALELYLKALGRLYGTSLHGHDLLKLFDDLPLESHDALRQNFGRAQWQCGIADMTEFRKALADLSKAFIEWRYLHEGRAGEIQFGPLIFVMEVAHETCRANAKLNRINPGER